MACVRVASTAKQINKYTSYKYYIIFAENINHQVDFE
jgi:hypothetical protein